MCTFFKYAKMKNQKALIAGAAVSQRQKSQLYPLQLVANMIVAATAYCFGVFVIVVRAELVHWSMQKPFLVPLRFMAGTGCFLHRTFIILTSTGSSACKRTVTTIVAVIRLK